jgi:hypothetical protein
MEESGTGVCGAQKLFVWTRNAKSLIEIEKPKTIVKPVTPSKVVPD